MPGRLYTSFKIEESRGTGREGRISSDELEKELRVADSCEVDFIIDTGNNTH